MVVRWYDYWTMVYKNDFLVVKSPGIVSMHIPLVLAWSIANITNFENPTWPIQTGGSADVSHNCMVAIAIWFSPCLAEIVRMVLSYVYGTLLYGYLRVPYLLLMVYLLIVHRFGLTVWEQHLAVHILPEEAAVKASRILHSESGIEWPWNDCGSVPSSHHLQLCTQVGLQLCYQSPGLLM